MVRIRIIQIDFEWRVEQNHAVLINHELLSRRYCLDLSSNSNIVFIVPVCLEWPQWRDGVYLAAQVVLLDLNVIAPVLRRHGILIWHTGSLVDVHSAHCWLQIVELGRDCV